MMEAGEPITMITAYDYPSAQVAEEAGVDIVLVGDSAAMVVLGYPGTEPVSMDEMIVLGKAVRRGLTTPLMVGDMPMGSYEASNELAVANAQRLVKETGCRVVKLEAGGTSVERARAIINAGHPGDGPRRPDPADGDRARRLQGPGQDRARRRSRSARTPSPCRRSAASRSSSRRSRRRSPRRSSRSSRSPTIGIGAGPATAGQVLVFHDLLGITTGRMAKFVKRYADIHDQMVAGVGQYVEEVRCGHFPEPDHVYGVEPAELDELRRYLDQESLTSQKAWDWEPLAS